MSYDFTNLITAIDTKGRALAAASDATGKDLVFLGKAVEALVPSATVSGVIAQGVTSTAAVTTQQATSVAAVTAAQATATTALNALAYPSPTTTAVDRTILNNEFCVVTAAGKTITLPNATAGQAVVYIGVGNFLDTVVAPHSGQKIMGLAESITLDRANTVITMQYHSTALGWRVY